MKRVPQADGGTPSRLLRSLQTELPLKLHLRGHANTPAFALSPRIPSGPRSDGVPPSARHPFPSNPRLPHLPTPLEIPSP